MEAQNWRALPVILLLAQYSLLSATAGAANNQRPHGEADSIPQASNASKTAAAPESKGIFAKPLMINGTGISMQLGGWVQADLIQDFDSVGNESQFKVNSIPVSGDPASGLGGATNFQIKQTRLSLDTRSSTEEGDMRAYIEGDFFGDGNSFRIRHAYGEWKGLLAGQTWSTFQDISARPSVVDYEGPDAEIFVRQVQIRYTHKVSDTLELAVAVEDPDSDITSAVAGTGRSEMPDIPAHARFTYPRGHVQVGGILRQLRFVSDDATIDETTTGWGLNLSGKFNLTGSDALMGQIAGGSGMGRYIESFSGQGSDAVLTAGNDLEALDAWAVVAGYEHFWSPKLMSTLSLSYAEVDNRASQPGTAIKSATGAYLNLQYEPTPLLLIGGELMFGEREDFSGADGDATRLQFSMRYKLR